MIKKLHIITLFFLGFVGLSLTIYSLSQISNFRSLAQSPKSGSIVIPQNPPKENQKDSLQLQTFPFITLTPTPTLIPTSTPPTPVNPDKNPTNPNNNSTTPNNPGGSGNNSAGNSQYVSPNRNTCGKYKFKSPIGNFGDPSCNFDKNALYALLKQLDPKNADRWFYKIVPCESGYYPSVYASQASIGTPDPGGAWGLYQMGSSKPPGSPPPAKGRNGINDRGDVNWQIQTSNAVTYGKRLKRLGAYWACAR